LPELVSLPNSAQLPLPPCGKGQGWPCASRQHAPAHPCRHLSLLLRPRAIFPAPTPEEQGDRRPGAGTSQPGADRGHRRLRGTPRRGENGLLFLSNAKGETPQTTAFEKGAQGSFYNRATTGVSFFPRN